MLDIKAPQLNLLAVSPSKALLLTPVTLNMKVISSGLNKGRDKKKECQLVCFNKNLLRAKFFFPFSDFPLEFCFCIHWLDHSILMFGAILVSMKRCQNLYSQFYANDHLTKKISNLQLLAHFSK